MKTEYRSINALLLLSVVTGRMEADKVHRAKSGPKRKKGDLSHEN